MKDELRNKLSLLRKIIDMHPRAAVAFSGGVDSSFLAFIVKETLGSENTLAITARTDLTSEAESKYAVDLAEKLGIPHKVVELDILSNPSVFNNPPDRCYYCKTDIFGEIIKAASESGFTIIMDGSNADDMDEYRPGRRALEERGILSPLVDAGFTKLDIRECAEKLELDFAQKPASPCLATRIPYHTKLDRSLLLKISEAEEFIQSLGVSNLRVRYHEHLARIEVAAENFDLIIKNKEKINARLYEIGFAFVTLDLAGFKSGSMNTLLDGTDVGSKAETD